MADIIQIRRDTAANWTSINPTLAQGEMGYESNTTKFKVGDGVLDWNTLAYMTTQGIPGVTGIQGVTGLQGNQGETGVGIQGATGVQGNQGETGVSIQGETGLIGATGVQGVQGNTGAQGIQGNTGLIGETGLQGPTGLQGVTGVGLAGTDYTIGVTAISGVGITLDFNTNKHWEWTLNGNVSVTGVTGPKGSRNILEIRGDGSTGLFGITGIDNIASCKISRVINQAEFKAGGMSGATGVHMLGGVINSNGVWVVTSSQQVI